MPSNTQTLSQTVSINAQESLIHAHRLLLRVGLSLINIFAWIFVFEYFFFLSGNTLRALAATVILYALAQLITAVATPISAAHLKRGVKHSLIWGVLFAAGAFVVLGGTFSGYFGGGVLSAGGSALAWGVIPFAVLLGAYRALYWVPYRLARSEVQTHRHTHAYFEVFIALMPLFAGLTLASVSHAHLQLLFGASVLMLLSALPALFLHDTHERFSWTLPYTFQQLWRRKNHGLVLQSLLEGAQGTVLFLIWPLAIFFILGWSYLGLGMVFTITLLFVLLFRRLYPWIVNWLGLRDSPTVHAVIAVSGWVARFAAGTPISIVVADVYAHTSAPRHGTHADSPSFEQASDRGAFLDEYTALKEMALALGRIMLCVTVFFLALVFSLPVVFAVALGVAAAASALSVLIARRGITTAY